MTLPFWTSKKLSTHSLIPHEMVKCKLYGYDNDRKTLKWIDSFFCDRQQHVELNPIGPPFFQVSPRAPILDLSYSQCTLLILQTILTGN